MPRYYCDYCDTYLTHDSPSVRKQHNAGYKHKANVRSYYQQFEEQQTQSLIDQRIKEHLGQTAAFQQVGAVYNQHLALNPQRPRLPVLPTPGLLIPGATQFVPGFRPPILPRPIPGPPGAAPTLGPPGAPSFPMQQIHGLPRPPAMNPPTTVPGSIPTSGSNSGPSPTPTMYQVNPATPTSGGFDGFNVGAAASVQRVTPGGTTAPASQDGLSYNQAPEANH